MSRWPASVAVIHGAYYWLWFVLYFLNVKLKSIKSIWHQRSLVRTWDRSISVLIRTSKVAVKVVTFGRNSYRFILTHQRDILAVLIDSSHLSIRPSAKSDSYYMCVGNNNRRRRYKRTCRYVVDPAVESASSTFYTNSHSSEMDGTWIIMKAIQHPSLCLCCFICVIHSSTLFPQSSFHNSSLNCALFLPRSVWDDSKMAGIAAEISENIWGGNDDIFCITSKWI